MSKPLNFPLGFEEYEKYENHTNAHLLFYSLSIGRKVRQAASCMLRKVLLSCKAYSLSSRRGPKNFMAPDGAQPIFAP